MSVPGRGRPRRSDLNDDGMRRKRKAIVKELVKNIEVSGSENLWSEAPNDTKYKMSYLVFILNDSDTSGASLFPD